MKDGLTTVSATHQASLGDYETIIRVEGLLPEGINLNFIYLGPVAKTAENSNQSRPIIQDSVTHRTVLTKDLADAHEIHIYYTGSDPKVFPGTTSLEISQEVFRELKTKGESMLLYRVFHQRTMEGAVSGLLNKLTNESGDLNLQDLASGSLILVNCALRRADPADVAFPVLVNDKPVELPAIHAICKSEQDELNMYVLDDSANPLDLASSSQTGKFNRQVTRISFPEDKPRNQIEEDLKKTGRAQIYGIYFDFASAKIRPQSMRVLEEIARAMKDNPSWSLSIEGHTDNIGGDTSNLELSKRRSASVMQALTSQYHIATNRFTASGFGSSHPVDTNDNMEGRARNRRVELVKQ
jgi:outer membrane protein OmpA-like peptidoglycan-associated protein